MPTPSYRVPVRVARGTKAALDAGLTDLQEGEVCYATDENALYVVETGVLTPTTNVSSIDDLTDVDTATTPPTTDQVLTWDGASWSPADNYGGFVDSVNRQIGAVGLRVQDMYDYGSNESGTPIAINFSTKVPSGAPTAAGEYGIYDFNFEKILVYIYNLDDQGDDADVPFTAWNALSTKYLIIDGISYEVTVQFINDTGDFTEVYLFKQGGPLLTALEASSAIEFSNAGPAVIPADGDVLQWDDSLQKFMPVAVSSAVSSVNTQTGAVSLGIEDMDDVSYVGVLVYDDKVDPEGSVAADGPGQYDVRSAGLIFLSHLDPDGVDNSTYLDTWQLGDTLEFTADDGVTKMTGNIDSTLVKGADNIYFNLTDYTNYGTIQSSTFITVANLTRPLTNNPVSGQVLTWDGNNWVAADQAGGGGGVTSIIAGAGISVDQATGDVTVTATGGGGAVDSVNGQTGVVSLGIQDMDDFSLNPAPGLVILRYDTFSDGGSTATAGSAGSFLTSNDRFIGNQFDSNGVDAIALQGSAITANGGSDSNLPVWFSSDGSNWTAAYSTSSNYPGDFRFSNIKKVSDNSVLNLITDITSSGPIYLTMSDPSQTDTPLAEGDILKWNDGDQKFKPAQLPDAIATRVLLGIGEYVDDAAAGTGGVTSGAMYYNTTSSDYRLKS